MSSNLAPWRHRAPVMATVASALCASVASAVLAVALCLTLIAQASVGVFAVESDSMAPAFGRGDLVVLQSVTMPQVGDVVTFRQYEQLVTHRLVAEARTPGRFETRGDANASNDPWTVAPAQMIGRVHLVIPRLGWGMLLANQQWGRALLALLVMLLVAGFTWSWPRATRVPAILLHPASGYAIP